MISRGAQPITEPPDSPTTSNREWLETGIKGGYIREIPFGQFENLSLLGRGGFANIFKATWKQAGKEVALKCSYALHDDELAINELVRELKLIRAVDYCDHVVKFYGITKDEKKGRYYIVLQYASGGTLREYLSQNFDTLTWQTKIRLAKEITMALVSIHGAGILHRDLHSKNVLLHNNKIIVADYGLAKIAEETSSSIQGGMVAYADPSWLENNSFSRTRASDIYSLGVLMWELSSGRQPNLNTRSAHELMNKLIKGERELPLKGTPMAYAHLFQECWQINPTKRPSAAEVLQALIELEPVIDRVNKYAILKVDDDLLEIPGPLVRKPSQRHLSSDERHSTDSSDSSSQPDSESAENIPIVCSCDKTLEVYSSQFRDNTAVGRCRAGLHAGSGDASGLRYHLDQNEDVDGNYRFNGQFCPLVILTARFCPSRRILDVLKVIKHYNGVIAIQDEKNNTALHWLAENSSLVRSSASARNSTNTQDYMKLAIEWLIAEGIDVNAQNKHGRTALSWFVEKEIPQAVDALLRFGADPNIPDLLGYTPLHRILNFEYRQYHVENLEIVTTLLSNKANPNLATRRDSGMYYPNCLFIAVHRNWPQEILQALMDRNANPQAHTSEGLGLYAYAQKRRNSKALSWMNSKLPDLVVAENGDNDTNGWNR